MWQNLRYLLVVGLLSPWMLTGCNQGDASHSGLTGVQPNESGVYPSNPFNPNTDEAAPASLEISETTFQFGKMAIHEERSHPFVIRNNGVVPVRLAMGPSTCQCTMGKLQTDVLRPGDQTEVVLTWKPETHSIEFAKGALIWTDIPEMPRIDFEVKGQVVPEVSILPSQNWSTGMLQEGVTANLSGFVGSPLFPEFEITKVESSDEWLTVEYSPADPESAASALCEVGYSIQCSVLPECPLGEFRGTLTVSTNLEDETNRELTIVVSGSRCGPFIITGRGWSGTSHGTLEIGDVSVTDGRSVELSLTMAPGDEPLRLTPIESNPQFLDFEMRKDEDYPATNRERYYLTFSIPPDAPLGEWVGENAGSIKFSTNLPDREEMTIRVEFSVKDLD